MNQSEEVLKAMAIPITAPPKETTLNILTIPEECAFDCIVRDYNCKDAVSLMASRGIVRWFRTFPVLKEKEDEK